MRASVLKLRQGRREADIMQEKTELVYRTAHICSERLLSSTIMKRN